MPGKGRRKILRSVYSLRCDENGIRLRPATVHRNKGGQFDIHQFLFAQAKRNGR